MRLDGAGNITMKKCLRKRNMAFKPDWVIQMCVLQLFTKKAKR